MFQRSALLAHMVVGSLRFSLRLHAAFSLKDKRRPRRMLTDKIRQRFKVAVAEVADHDTLNLLTMGVATVGPDAGPVEKVLRAVIDFVEETGEGELISEHIELERY